MKKIAFFSDNRFIRDIDLRFLEKGNPGIGGVEFQTYLLAYELSLLGDYDVSILSVCHADENKRILPEYVVGTIDAAANFAIEHGIEALFFRQFDVPKKPKGKKIKFFSIFHNRPDPYDMLAFRRQKDVDAFVFLTRQELLRHVCFSFIRKRGFVCPLFPAPDVSLLAPRSLKKPVACFIGALVPEKGADILCRLWPSVLRVVPDAELWIIGGPSIWRRDTALGPRGIAEEGYEERLLMPIRECEGSVKFFGVLGHDEIDRLLDSVYVGIPKPSIRSEAFCLSALDFEKRGIPVITRRTDAFIETVSDDAGIRFVTEQQLLDAIITLLTNKEKNVALGRNGFNHYLSHFSKQVVIPSWHKMIRGVLLEDFSEQSVSPADWFRSSVMYFEYQIKGVYSKIKRHGRR